MFRHPIGIVISSDINVFQSIDLYNQLKNIVISIKKNAQWNHDSVVHQQHRKQWNPDFVVRNSQQNHDSVWPRKQKKYLATWMQRVKNEWRKEKRERRMKIGELGKGSLIIDNYYWLVGTKSNFIRANSNTL